MRVTFQSLYTDSRISKSQGQRLYTSHTKPDFRAIPNSHQQSQVRFGYLEGMKLLVTGLLTGTVTGLGYLGAKSAEAIPASAEPTTGLLATIIAAGTFAGSILWFVKK